MTDYENALSCLPPRLREVLDKLPDKMRDGVQEIRLRVGAPLVLSVGCTDWLLTREGAPISREGTSLYICDYTLLSDCFQTLCEYSVHTHQQEIRHGYISAKNGCRAGIAGTVVLENGQITSMRRITSICLRVARAHTGCANQLTNAVLQSGCVTGTLICGEPSSGKTSLLRDLAEQLSGGEAGRRYRVAVVDERGELSGVRGLRNCDVLLHCPKGQGIEQAVRCLAPDVVLFDELGSMDEANAVRIGLNAGVSAIASAHCRDLASIKRRPALMAALESGAFDQIVLLSGRQAPGRIEKIVRIEDFLEEPLDHQETDTVRDVYETHRNTFDCGSRHMAGNIGVAGPWKKGDSALTG